MRYSLYPSTRMELILNLQEMLHQVNPYVKDFKYLLDHPPPPNMKITIDANKRPEGKGGTVMVMVTLSVSWRFG